MVFVVQLLIVLCVAAFRIFWLLGQHLRVSKQSDNPSHLEMIGTNKHGKLTQCFFGVTQGYGFPFVVRRERWYHRFLKRCGIASEIQMGDEAWDSRWFFITDYPDHLERAMRSDEFRRKLKAVLALPVSKVVSTPTRLWCKFDCSKLSKDSLERKRYWTAIETLRDEKQKLIPRTSKGHRLRIEAFLFLGLHSALFWFALVGLLPTMLDHNEIIDKLDWITTGLFLAVPVVALWLAAIIWQFHGTSWAGWVLADFFLAGLIGLIISTGYFARDFNIMLDYSAPQLVERTLTSRVCEVKCKKSCGRRCTKRRTFKIPDVECSAATRAQTIARYRESDSVCRSSAWYEFTLTMPHWLKGTDRFSYEASAEIYDQTRYRRNVVVPRRTGALGIEWVDTDTIAPK